MDKSGFSVGSLGLAAALVVMLAAGSVWAAESQTAAVPAGNSYTVSAVIVPGSGGADVYGGGEEQADEYVEFSVGFGADGMLTVNGEAGPAYSAGATYTVTVECDKVGGVWYATTTVRNQTTGVVEFTQTAYAMAAAAQTVVARAQQVVGLDVS